jgi:hypothetical protein
VGIHRLLNSSCCFLNTNSAITRQLIRRAESLPGRVGTGTMEVESSAGRILAARFHHVTARSRLARVLKLTKRLFL